MRSLIFIAFLIGLFWFLAQRFPYALSNDFSQSRVLYLSLILLFAAFSLRKIPFTQTVAYSLFWILLIGLLVAGYSYKEEIKNSRFVAVLFHNQPTISASGGFSIMAGEDGHYRIEGKVNGTSVNFLVDTGASDVVLSQNDAKRAGIDTSSLTYNKPYSTANGMGFGASIRLKGITIGDFFLYDFPASVNGGGLEESLLGMRALEKIGKIKIENGKMTVGKTAGLPVL